MTNKDLLKFCFGNLRRRKTRSVLSIIGVVIGTCAIVIMMSIGIGLSASFQEEIESFGNLHLVEVYNWGSGNSSGKTEKLDDKTLAKIEKIDGVTCVSGLANIYVNIGSGHMVNSVQITGMKPEMMEMLNMNIEKGRVFNSTDKAPLVFGRNAAAQFYETRKQQYADWSNTEPTVDVLGKFVITNDYNYGTNKEGEKDEYDERELVYLEAQGVGMLANENDEYAYGVYSSVDYVNELNKTIKKANKETIDTASLSTYEQAYVYVEDINKVVDVCNAIKENYGFSTYSLNDILKEMQKMTGIIEAVLGGIGAVSLLVAAIGIANTMIMSVYERTREISVMKVIGASLEDIRKMFLVEAGMIGLTGGIIGLGLSYGLSFLGNKVILPMVSGSIGFAGSRISVIPVWLALASLVFTTLIGVISGYSPAQRAMNLSVLEGLKNE